MLSVGWDGPASCWNVHNGWPADSIFAEIEILSENTSTEILKYMQGLGLCHGVSGNAYALVAAARASGRHADYNSALHFGVFMAANWEQLYNVPSQPASLYEVNLLQAK